MACSGTTLNKSTFVLKSDSKLGQISFCVDPLPNVPISHAIYFGSGPPPPFWDNVLKSVFFFIFKASLIRLVNFILIKYKVYLILEFPPTFFTYERTGRPTSQQTDQKNDLIALILNKNIQVGSPLNITKKVRII